MASDLSQLIQDSFTSTLNGLLAKDATIVQITKAHPKDLESINLLKVQSVFDFSNFSSSFLYMLPAKTSSLIFNTMMGSSVDNLSDIIDDDTEDAIGEFISNTSGGFTTAINGEGFEDIGQTKFNVSQREKIIGSDINDLESTFRFQIDLEGNEVIIFITFDEAILPYIAEITASGVTEHIEEVPEPIVEEIKEEPIIETSLEPEINDTEEEDNDDLEINPKEKKMKIAIIAIGSILVIVLTSFLVLYFLGTFDPEPIPIKEEDSNITKMEIDKNKVEIIEYKTLKKVTFKASEIDTKRLNSQLLELTKYKVLNKEELAAQELAEKNRLFELEKEKELIAFSKKNHEEAVFTKIDKDINITIDKKTKFTDTNLTVIKETIVSPQENVLSENMVTLKEENTDTANVVNEDTIIKEDPIDPDQMRYIISESLKYSLFKSLVQETNTQQARISICNDESGKTAIYIGPFESNQLQEKMISLSNEKDQTIIMNKVNITEKEFNLRCNLE